MNQPPNAANPNRGSTIFRLIAVWDLCLCLPFALPLVNAVSVDGLRLLHGWLGSSAQFPDFAPFHLFFVQLFGILGVLWALVRIQRPQAWLAAWDAAGRLVVAIVMISFWLQGGTPVTALFSLSELGWGLVAAVLLLRARAKGTIFP